MSAKVGLFCSVLLLLYTLVVRYGYSDYAMQLYRGSQPTPVTFFRRFDLCGKIILLSLVIYLCTYLWSLLFVIPGVIAWYRYRMSRYVLLDHPDMGVLTAWAHSKRMMQGRKAQLFLLDLSCAFVACLIDLTGRQCGRLSFGQHWCACVALLCPVRSGLHCVLCLSYSLYGVELCRFLSHGLSA